MVNRQLNESTLHYSQDLQQPKVILVPEKFAEWAEGDWSYRGQYKEYIIEFD
jgi:hypothetical protein